MRTPHPLRQEHKKIKKQLKYMFFRLRVTGRRCRGNWGMKIFSMADVIFEETT